VREVAFIPTHKDEMLVIKRKYLEVNKKGSPEVLDVAASSERIAKQDPESRDEEAVRLAMDETHLAFS
jgi:hypothetical protein